MNREEDFNAKAVELSRKIIETIKKTPPLAQAYWLVPM